MNATNLPRLHPLRPRDCAGSRDLWTAEITRILARCFWIAVLSSLLGTSIFLSETVNAQEENWQPSKQALQACNSIQDAVFRSHIRFLADDLLEGRGPGTRGDDLAQLYIRTQLEAMGIKPGAGEGNWFQDVPLVGVSTSPPTSVAFQSTRGKLVLNHFDDMMLVSGSPVTGEVAAEGELVFVGYGIQAPEYGWDDFKGQDMTGKILVFLNNDPQDDPELFEGRKRLYYGRWDYKYAKAAEVGAAGALIIHTTPSAGYPYQVVQTSWAGEEFRLASDAGPKTKFNGWITEEAAKRLLTLSESELSNLVLRAQEKDFKPVPLGIRTSIRLKSLARQKSTRNVIGFIEGSDPKLKNQYVVFTAHHDHIGLAAERDETGDNIYNGAIDNASGTASLLSIAQAFTKLTEPPRRSILFAFVGAEEQGLLGSKHFALNPPVPAGAMAAVLNIDGINFLGKTYDLSIVGNGKSNLDQIVRSVAGWQKRTVVPDPNPDKGYYYRSDQFSLAQIGVPGVYLDSGLNYVGRPDGWGKQQLDQWIEKTYHQPSDEYDDSWNLEGAIEDAQLLMHTAIVVANQDSFPTWVPGDEFEAARKRALAELRLKQ